MPKLLSAKPQFPMSERQRDPWSIWNGKKLHGQLLHSLHHFQINRLRWPAAAQFGWQPSERLGGFEYKLPVFEFQGCWPTMQSMAETLQLQHASVASTMVSPMSNAVVSRFLPFKLLVKGLTSYDPMISNAVLCLETLKLKSSSSCKSVALLAAKARSNGVNSKSPVRKHSTAIPCG